MIHINVMTAQQRKRLSTRRWNESTKSYKMRWAATNADKCERYRLLWRDKNPTYKIKNTERRRQTARQWAIKNSEQRRQQLREWKKAHPDKVRILHHIRRARKFGNGGSWTVEEWLTLKCQYGFHCVSCWKTEIELKVLERIIVPDHVVALSSYDCEGRPGLNSIENLQPLCHGTGGCNNKKGSKYHDFCIS